MEFIGANPVTRNSALVLAKPHANTPEVQKLISTMFDLNVTKRRAVHQEAAYQWMAKVSGRAVAV